MLTLLTAEGGLDVTSRVGRCLELLLLPTSQQSNNIWNVPRRASLCIPAVSHLKVTDIPQHHHLNKWAGKYFCFIFTQEPGNSRRWLDVWTESSPLHTVNTLSFCWRLLSETDHWRQHSWARCCPCRSLQRGTTKRKEPGTFTVQVLPFYCGFSLGLTNPPLPCQPQTGLLNRC